MLDADFDPVKLANPASGFRFPPKTPSGDDMQSTELRLALSGWLKYADQIVTTNAGLQELRDAVFRAAEISVALCARFLAVEKERQSVSDSNVKRSLSTGANGHEKPNRKKANPKTAAPLPASAKEKPSHA